MTVLSFYLIYMNSTLLPEVIVTDCHIRLYVSSRNKRTGVADNVRVV